MNIVRGNLTIRKSTPDDAKQLCLWWNDGKIMAHAGFPNGLGKKPKDIRKCLAANTNDTQRLCIIELDGKPIGEMSYRNKGNGTTEIGIKICDFTNHKPGMGTELLAMFIDELFSNYGYKKIIIDTNLNNLRAQHVYENKLGFHKLRVNKDSWYDQLGVAQSSIDYELTKAQWEKQKLARNLVK